jgi:hypothetical protein
MLASWPLALAGYGVALATALMATTLWSPVELEGFMFVFVGGQVSGVLIWRSME